MKARKHARSQAHIPYEHTDAPRTHPNSNCGTYVHTAATTVAPQPNTPTNICCTLQDHLAVSMGPHTETSESVAVAMWSFPSIPPERASSQAQSARARSAVPVGPSAPCRPPRDEIHSHQQVHHLLQTGHRSQTEGTHSYHSYHPYYHRRHCHHHHYHCHFQHFCRPRLMVHGRRHQPQQPVGCRTRHPAVSHPLQRRQNSAQHHRFEATWTRRLAEKLSKTAAASVESRARKACWKGQAREVHVESPSPRDRRLRYGDWTDLGPLKQEQKEHECTVVEPHTGWRRNLREWERRHESGEFEE